MYPIRMSSLLSHIIASNPGINITIAANVVEYELNVDVSIGGH